MFDIGWPELLLVMVVALIVIGPKELPNAIRTVTMVVRKVRTAAREFQNGLDDIARESGLDDVKRQFDDIDYYDPGEALKSIAESDKDLLGLDDDPAAGNSILDPEKKPAAPAGDEASADVPEADTAEAASPASGDDATEPHDNGQRPVTGGGTS
jgi:sec-independent protein translocase protein TatB